MKGIVKIFAALIAFCLPLAAQNPSKNFLQLQKNFEGVRVLNILPPLPLWQENNHPVPAPPQQEHEDASDLPHLQVLQDVNGLLSLIERAYPGPVKHREMRDAAFRGMLRALDPYSELFTPKLTKSWGQDQENNRAEIGVLWEKKIEDEPASVRFAIPGGPSLGILENGDRILKINGDNTEAMSMDEVLEKIQGNPGTKVRLTVISKNAEGRAPPKEVEITRANIKLAAVHYEMLDRNNGIGYIQLADFLWDSGKEFESALRSLQKQGAKALILDLRDNGGGLVYESTTTAAMFLSKNDLIVTSHYKEISKTARAQENGMAKNMKVAILVNGHSASGSEIFAGALQDHKRAVLVGSETYGKGLIQTIIPHAPEEGYAIKLTIGKYTTPLGRSVQRDKRTGKGALKPDIEVVAPLEQEIKLAQERFGRLLGPKPVRPLKDAVLEKALEYLQAPPLAKK